MTEKETYIFIAGLIIWICLSIYASIKAKRYFTIDKSRLKLNLILIWLLPFLWALLIITMTREVKKKKSDGYEYREAGYGNYTKWGG